MRNGTKLVIAGIGVAAVLGGGSALAVAANSAPASVSGSTAASFSRVSPETQVDLGTLADATPAPSAGGTAQRVSREQAIQIAQRRVPGAQVVKVERDVENGRQTWEVELRDGRTEFEVHVAIDNGEIIKFEQDFDDDFDDLGVGGAPPSSAAPAPSASATPSAGGGTRQVSREQAIQIAQRRVPGARVTEVEREVEHGRATWKVELRDGRTEFEVHVAIDNGEIIEFEQDFDD